jgi:hypothetical protein
MIPTLLKATSIAASIGVGPVGFSTLGGYFTVALDSTGQDWGWGTNNDGEVFPLTVTPGSLSTDRPYAMKDPILPFPFFKIAAGAYHTCLLAGFSSGGVFCRGNNHNTQSGVGAPGFVPGTQFSVDVAAGGYHTCAVALDSTTPADGSIMCWGENGDGQVTGTISGDVTSPSIINIGGIP